MQPLSWIAWNLLLAGIPVAAAYALAMGAERFTVRKRSLPWVVWLPLALIWLAFLPNTCYLLTEWRHFLFDPHYVGIRDMVATDRVLMLRVAKQALWFLMYSGSGVVCFALSLRPIERLLRRAHLLPAWWGVPFFFLVSLGVYMGLIERLNSWNLLNHPGHVLTVSVHALTTALILKPIVVFAVLLWIMYRLVDIWVDGFAAKIESLHKARG